MKKRGQDEFQKDDAPSYQVDSRPKPVIKKEKKENR